MKQTLLLLLLPILVLPLAYAQVFEGVTGTNSTSTTPAMDLTSISWNQGALLTIKGSNVSIGSDVDVTIYHPNNSKFGIFKAISTKSGEFSIPVELVHTSLQGEYTIHALVNGTELVKKFTYSGANNIAVSEIEEPIVEPIEEPTVEPITNSTATNSTNTTPEQTAEPIESPTESTGTNWDQFIMNLHPSDRVDLINAIIRYLLS